MAHLAQAYIHFKPFSATDQVVEQLSDVALAAARQAAVDLYGGGVRVEIEIEEGSLVTRVTVVGGILLGAYGIVADYKGFKESVASLCEDAREFAIDVCGPIASVAGVPEKEIYRFERRLKTPGKIYRIVKRMEKLERSLAELSLKDVERELAGLRGELDAVAIDLNASEIDAVSKGLMSSKLPAPSKWPIPDHPRVLIGNKRLDEELPLRGGERVDVLPPVRRVRFRTSIEIPKEEGNSRRVRPKSVSLPID